MTRSVSLAGAVLVAYGLGGCAWRTPAAAPTRYPEAFHAACRLLRDLRFELDRVDARTGVITTRPRYSSGLATPWDLESSSPPQAVEDLLNHHRRVVRIAFEPVADTPAATGTSGSSPPACPVPDTDLRRHRGAVQADIQVVIERRCRPGWRLDPTAPRAGSFAADPQWKSAGLWPDYWIPLARDRVLEQRIARHLGVICAVASHAPTGPTLAP